MNATSPSAGGRLRRPGLRPFRGAEARARVVATGMRARGAAMLLCAGLLTGCASRVPLPTRPAPESLPAGSPLRSRTLDERDAWLRHYVMFGEHPDAIAAFADRSPLAPRDRLLRALQEAVVLHQAGDYAASNARLEWAEVEADLRYTRSLSRQVGSILVNDNVLAYTPTAGELAMVPYYRMLNYLAMRDLAGALVEARKANAVLARFDREPLERCNEDGMVQYLAGLVQRAAGEMNDALVSLRQAERFLAGCPGTGGGAAAAVAADLHRTARAAGVTEVADSIAERYDLQGEVAAGGAMGDLLVVVEHGFVAHRTEEALHVPLVDDDLKDLDSEDEDGLTRLAAHITSRLMLEQDGRDHWGRRRRHYRSGWSDALDGAYILRLAWPTYRLESNRPRAVRLGVGDAVAAPIEVGDLSLVMREELADERPAMLARLVLRGLTKYLVSREVEQKTEKKHGDTAGFLLGRLTNLAANQLEQADTRSWSLLPDRISILRLRLAPGSYPVTLEVFGEQGESSVRELGEVTIEPGRLAVLRQRVWAGDAEGRWEEEFDPLEVEEPAMVADSVVVADAD
ncbi:MAG TPA: hypothetical protein VFZ18_07655 [Longimicrobiaceae bacterium]